MTTSENTPPADKRIKLTLFGLGLALSVSFLDLIALSGCSGDASNMCNGVIIFSGFAIWIISTIASVLLLFFAFTRRHDLLRKTLVIQLVLTLLLVALFAITAELTTPLGLF